MKKLIYTTALAFMGLALNAQVKVWNSPAGYVGVGSTSTTPSKPLDVIGSGGIQVSQTDSANTDNELYFKDNGQIRSSDNNHHMIFYRSANIMELREFGNIIFSPGSSGTRTQKVVFNSSGNVGIGVGTTLTANTKFDVLTTGSVTAGSNSYGVHAINTNTAPSGSNTFIYGTYGESSGTSTGSSIYNYGGSFKSSNGYNCVGVGGISIAPSTAAISYAGYFNSSYSASGGTGYSQAVTAYVGSNGGRNIAVYASAPSSSNNTLSNWAGFFVNDVYINGNGWINAAWTVSDRQFKTNINAISNPTDILKKLKPQSFYFDTANTVGMSFSGKKTIRVYCSGCCASFA
ncbi:MAG: tail fiber domain-containing protein [Bacteroidia bacterium]